MQAIPKLKKLTSQEVVMIGLLHLVVVHCWNVQLKNELIIMWTFLYTSHIRLPFLGGKQEKFTHVFLDFY